MASNTGGSYYQSLMRKYETLVDIVVAELGKDPADKEKVAMLENQQSALKMLMEREREREREEREREERNAMPGPDTSGAYLRKALTSSGAPGQLLQQDPSDSTDLASFLKQPLSLKLPVLRGHSGPAVTDSAIMDYIIMVDEVVAAQVQQLSVLVANVLHGKRSQSVYEHNTVSMVHAVVDEPLAMAAEALGLPVQLDRNQQDASGATAGALRPDMLCWLNNALLFKGEEKAALSEFQAAIAELGKKMAQAWCPVFLPGVSMPCMLAYAAAGNFLQFFAIRKRDSNDCVVVEPISSPLRLDTPAGRIQIVHSVLNIVRLLADYYINLPVIPVALGQRTVKWHPDGSKRSDVTFFSDFVLKRVYDFDKHHTGINDHTVLKDLYKLGTCPHLARLTSKGMYLHGGTLVLHLEPVGVPQSGPPADEATLKRAVGGVLKGLAQLHLAGFVHRDIRWPNIVQVPQDFGIYKCSDFVLIDMEHAARADSTCDCRQPPFPLTCWPQRCEELLEPETGRYTPASDLCLVAHCLLSNLPFTLSDEGAALRQALAARQVMSADAALNHAWFMEDV